MFLIHFFIFTPVYHVFLLLIPSVPFFIYLPPSVPPKAPEADYLDAVVVTILQIHVTQPGTLQCCTVQQCSIQVRVR